MPELVPLTNLLVGRQEAVHRPFGAEVSALIEEGCVDLRGGEIHEPRLVQHGENGGALCGTERAGGRSAARRSALGPPSVVGRPRYPEDGARPCDAKPRSNLGHRRHQDVSLSGGVPSNAAMFF
jgi:hypothetical protein